MSRAVLSLGSNVGDRRAHLQAAVNALATALAGVRVSPVYETAPVGGPPQPDYLNAIVVADDATGVDLLSLIRAVESSAGRERSRRWGPRTLDVDVIAVGDTVCTGRALTLPHPRAHERAFVLAPWLDLDPDAELVGQGRVADLLTRLGNAGVRRRDDLALVVP